MVSVSHLFNITIVLHFWNSQKRRSGRPKSHPAGRGTLSIPDIKGVRSSEKHETVTVL